MNKIIYNYRKKINKKKNFKDKGNEFIRKVTPDAMAKYKYCRNVFVSSIYVLYPNSGLCTPPK